LQAVHREGRTLRPWRFSPSITSNPNLTRYRTPVGRVGTKTPQPVRVRTVILAIATYLMPSINKRFAEVKKIFFACDSPVYRLYRSNSYGCGKTLGPLCLTFASVWWTGGPVRMREVRRRGRGGVSGGTPSAILRAKALLRAL